MIRSRTKSKAESWPSWRLPVSRSPTNTARYTTVVRRAMFSRTSMEAVMTPRIYGIQNPGLGPGPLLTSSGVESSLKGVRHPARDEPCVCHPDVGSLGVIGGTDPYRQGRANHALSRSRVAVWSAAEGPRAGRQAEPFAVPRRFHVSAFAGRVCELEVTDCDFKLGWHAQSQALCLHGAGGGDALQCASEPPGGPRQCGDHAGVREAQATRCNPRGTRAQAFRFGTGVRWTITRGVRRHSGTDDAAPACAPPNWVSSVQVTVSLGVRGFTLRESRDEILDPLPPGLWFLRRRDPEENGEPVAARQDGKKGLGLRVLGEGLRQLRVYPIRLLRVIGRFPPSIGLGPIDLRLTGRAHPPRGNQHSRLLTVDLGPDAPGAAGREFLQPGPGVLRELLPVNPPMTQRHLERLGVVHGPEPGVLLGDAEPKPRLRGSILGEPGIPSLRVGEELDGVVGWEHGIGSRAQASAWEVRPEGVEPSREVPQDPKSCASASSATVAKLQNTSRNSAEGRRRGRASGLPNRSQLRLQGQPLQFLHR